MRKRSTTFVHTASGVKFTQQDIDRFWSKIDKREEGECWNLRSSSTKMRHGTFYVDGKYIGTHRVAYLICCGDIPGKLHVLHKCDNPRCCNPAHLRTGTHQENIQECVDRCRNPVGEENKCSKLAEEEVIAIRSKYATGLYTQMELAVEYGCSGPNVCQIVNGNLWKHIGGEPRENRHLPPSRKRTPIVIPPRRRVDWRQKIRDAFYATQQ